VDVLTKNTMKIDNVHFNIDGLPKELENKTFREVFDVVREKSNRIISHLKSDEDWKGIKEEESWYLRMAQMLKKLASGNTEDVQFGIKSPTDYP
jgi:hypothetical protein